MNTNVECLMFYTRTDRDISVGITNSLGNSHKSLSNSYYYIAKAVTKLI